MQVQLFDIYEPFTLSCVLRVGVKQFGGNEQPGGYEQRHGFGVEVAMLKLYDRRFAAQLYPDHDIEDWNESHELAYRTLIASGRATEFSKESECGEFGDTDAWSVGENEPYLQVLWKDMFDAATLVYAALHN